MYKCKICGKEFTTKQKLGGHASSHNRGEVYKSSRAITGEREYRRKRAELGDKRSCKFCGKEFTAKGIGGHVSRCNSNPNAKSTHIKVGKGRKGSVMSDEAVKKISASMKKAHSEGRAWNIGKSRWNNEKSYPEKFFQKVIDNEFINKKYECEYPIGIYSLDFAWVELKKAIEIDGDQHERFEEYKQRDERKDKLCAENGWQVLRIKWKDLYNNTKQKIKEAKQFIGE
jgi:very-short-patch-repair endonuclease